MTLHPWNVDFKWVDSFGPYRALTDAQAEQFDGDGYVVVPDVFTPEEIAAVRAITDSFDAESEAFLKQQQDGRIMIAESGAITFSAHLVGRSPELAAFARHPKLVDICLDLIGDDVNLYWDQAVYKKPEKPRRFPWHQDNGYAYVEPQQYLTCWIPLTDATVSNGCPHVARGLHRDGTLQHTYIDPLGYECFSEPPAEEVVAEAPVGSVVVFSSLTPHLTGPNTTDAVRKAYILQYAPVGAAKLQGDPTAGPAVNREMQDDPTRQFPVARRGSSAN
ncbi:MAG: hypothetical protein QOF21_414 [Actinomycetota bacterium]